MTNDQNDARALRDLADRYARSMDDRDAATLIDLFVPDGILTISAEDTREFPSPAGLEKIIDYMARYDQTFYFVGNHICDVDGDHATGETYTVAYHYSRNADGTRTVIESPVRYVDTYLRTDRGWRFQRRDARILWTDKHSVSD